MLMLLRRNLTDVPMKFPRQRTWDVGLVCSVVSWCWSSCCRWCRLTEARSDVALGCGAPENWLLCTETSHIHSHTHRCLSPNICFNSQHTTSSLTSGDARDHWKKTLNSYNSLSLTYLLRLSSSRSEQNIGRRVVSIWHDRWQYLSHHSSQHPVCPNLLSVCLVMSSLVVRPPPAIFWYPF